MKIAVTFAMDWEFKPWRRLRRFQESSSDRRVYQAPIAGGDLSVFLTGIGSRNAERAASIITAEYAPDICIISGLAGGLKASNRTGSILVAGAVSSETRAESVQPEGKLLALAVERGAKPVEQFVSVSHVARTVEEKLSLGKFADAVDMESFTLMAVMGRSGIPAVAIRAIADPAELAVPYDCEQMLDAFGRVRVGNLAGQIAQAPKGLWPLTQLGLASIRATGSLARYLDGYVNYAAEIQLDVDLTLEHVAQ